MVIEEVQKTLNIDKSDWTLVKLGDVVQEVRETVKDPAAEGIDRIIGLEHIESENIHIKSWGQLSEGTTFTKVFRKGQVLFGRRRAYLKKAAIATFDGICSGDITVLEAKKGLLPELLPFLIQNDKFFDLAIQNSAGSLSPRAKFKDLADYEFLLPPKEQQQQLAELLWAADEVVERERKLNTAQSRMFESSRNAIFSIESMEHNLNVLNDLNYYEKPFEDLMKAKMLNGIYKSKEFHGDGVRIINMGELFAHQVISEQEMPMINLSPKELKQFLVRVGDLIFARRSLVIEGAGRCSIIGEHVSPMTFESSMIRARLNSDLVNPKYVFHFLKSAEGKKRIRRIVGFTTVAGITSTDLAKISIPYVSLERQNSIVNFLESFDFTFNSLDLYKGNSSRIQKSLIDQFF